MQSEYRKSSTAREASADNRDADFDQSSARHTRIQRWRQAYRNSQPQTFVDQRWTEGQTVDYSCTTPDARTVRRLPEEPLVFPKRQSSEVHGHIGYLSPDSLRPPGLRNVGRASSFEGRTRTADSHENLVLSPRHDHQFNQTKHEYWSPPVSHGQTLTKRSQIENKYQNYVQQNRRDRLVVAPSIEISHVHENSDSSSSSDQDEVRGERPRQITQRVNSSASLPARELSNHSIQESVLSQTAQTVQFSTLYSGSSRHLSRPTSQNSTDSMNSMESLSANAGRDRPKLTRQPRSFQTEPPSQAGRHSDCVDRTRRSNAPVDEFDYFCQIANSPSGSTNQPSTRTSVSLKPSRHAAAFRSHSMRMESPDVSPVQIDRRAVGQRSNDSVENVKSAYLKPPCRGQLRRASTEEDRNKIPLSEKKMMAATLSYSSVNSGVQNVCRTPPKYLPPVPVYPTSICNPSVPLGVPLTEDSLFADEPGMTYYQVQVLGATGVGKTLLCQQLARLTSGQSEPYDFDEDENPQTSHSVTAALCGSIYTVNFIDSSSDNFEQTLEIKIHDCIDAFIVVYAIDDSSSYEAARVIMNALSPAIDLCQSPSTTHKTNPAKVIVPTPVYLVANKTDLVRGRQVSNEDGRHLANLYEAKFLEVSASLNHMIAELFVQLVQLLGETENKGRDPRLPSERRPQFNQFSPSKAPIKTVNTFRLPTSAKSTLSKFFKRHFTRTSEDSD
ncbi:hypothetical protein EG68_00531 [Paragonimus skrjabini miyazakii]|uniref:GTP-binding protein GEM n=1 Tax=Paragonimus skrjabini miyazakii TaxID=59628 RepID=A0A8S9ZA77_9TREM|nr:hypothetical protein EG68_00531 [Paragonimus skrjabini miyazakii]